MALVIALLVGVVLWASARRRACPQGAGRGGGGCCPLVATLAVNPAPSSTGSATNQSTAEITAPPVIAYYFHGTVRCETCVVIEGMVRAVIENEFKAELEAKQLLFLPLNYDLPENAHFLADYKLPCPSLVLVRQQEGAKEQWKLLGDAWQLAHDPAKLNRFVETEVRAFMAGEEQQTRTNQIGAPSSPDYR